MTTALRLELRTEAVEVVEDWQVSHRRERELEASGFDETDEDVPAMWLDYHREDEVLPGDEPSVMTRRKLRKENA